MREAGKRTVVFGRDAPLHLHRKVVKLRFLFCIADHSGRSLQGSGPYRHRDHHEHDHRSPRSHRSPRHGDRDHRGQLRRSSFDSDLRGRSPRRHASPAPASPLDRYGDDRRRHHRGGGGHRDRDRHDGDEKTSGAGAGVRRSLTPRGGRRHHHQYEVRGSLVSFEVCPRNLSIIILRRTVPFADFASRLPTECASQGSPVIFCTYCVFAVFLAPEISHNMIERRVLVMDKLAHSLKGKNYFSFLNSFVLSGPKRLAPLAAPQRLNRRRRRRVERFGAAPPRSESIERECRSGGE